MNIIRSTAVELTAIPAIAYKMKLQSGGSGLKIHRLDTDAVAVFTLDKRTGDAVAYGDVDAALFSTDAVDEALDLTNGLPYSARGKIKVTAFTEPEPEQEDVTPEDEPELVDMVNSPEYEAFVERYSDEKGKMNYQLMNKDLIQFASRSKTVAKMTGEGASEDDIVKFIVNSRAGLLAGRKDAMSDDEVTLLIETLDEIDRKSVV